MKELSLINTCLNYSFCKIDQIYTSSKKLFSGYTFDSFPSQDQTTRISKVWQNWAITGGIPAVGALIGSLQQIYGDSTGLSFLEGVNAFKQLEIKNFSFLIPAIPIVYDLVIQIKADQSQDCIIEKIRKGFSHLDCRFLAQFALTLGLTMAASQMNGMLRTGWLAFRISGHLLTKVATSHALAASLTQVQNHKHSYILTALATAYAASDALMLHKTALQFHTPAELIAGTVWGLLNLILAHSIIERWMSKIATTDK